MRLCNSLLLAARVRPYCWPRRSALLFALEAGGPRSAEQNKARWELKSLGGDWPDEPRFPGAAAAINDRRSGYGSRDDRPVGASTDAPRYLSRSRRAGALRCPALWRHGPPPNGRVSGQLLRISFPLYHWH